MALSQVILSLPKWIFMSQTDGMVRASTRRNWFMAVPVALGKGLPAATLAYGFLDTNSHNGN